LNLIFVGSVVCLIGAVLCVFCVRWAMNAIHPNRAPTIDPRERR
jgi:hypothetical protein